MHNKVVRFIDCHVPVSVCNFVCEYCSVAQKTSFGTQYKPFSNTVQHIAKAFSKERFGGLCAINLCGNGETLLHPDAVPLAGLLLQDGHYVSIVSNGTVQAAMDALFALPSSLKERLFIKFSFHFAELKKRNILSRYVENVKSAKKHGISFTVELVASECNIPFINEIKECCLANFGALCHVTDPRSMVKEGMPRLASGNLEEHQARWRQFDSALFDYRQATWGVNRRREFCYAGEFGGCLSLANGFLQQCNRGKLQNVFADIDEPMHFMACGNNCPFPHCFNSHVWDCFVGVIPGIQSPTYADLRNRVCADGSEWLFPPYKALYSKRLCTQHEEYDERRKIFTNGIMALTHGKGEPGADFADAVGMYLHQSRITRGALYGDNNLSRWLCGNIRELTILDDSAVNFDAVRVTDFKNIVQSRVELASRTSAPVMDICDLHSAKIGKSR